MDCIPKFLACPLLRLPAPLLLWTYICIHMLLPPYPFLIFDYFPACFDLSSFRLCKCLRVTLNTLWGCR